MRTLLAGLALLPILLTGSGCASLIETSVRYPAHVNGGVEIDCMLLGMPWLPSESDKEKQSSWQRIAWNVFGASLAAVDLPLSFVCDTILLPSVLVDSGFHGWDFGRGPSATAQEKRPSLDEVVNGLVDHPAAMNVEAPKP